MYIHMSVFCYTLPKCNFQDIFVSAVFFKLELARIKYSVLKQMLTLNTELFILSGSEYH